MLGFDVGSERSRMPVHFPEEEKVKDMGSTVVAGMGTDNCVLIIDTFYMRLIQVVVFVPCRQIHHLLPFQCLDVIIDSLCIADSREFCICLSSYDPFAPPIPIR